MRARPYLAVVLSFGIVSCAPTKTSSPSPSESVDWSSAIAAYRTYVITETDALVKDGEDFVAALNAGDRTKAMKLYAPTRMHYERIEPIAEALGDLDPRIDARVNDVAAGQEWTGFHRLEKALWEEKTTLGLKEVTTKLMTDITLLRAKVETVDITVSQLIGGAVDLLNEVATSKITGEEDRYSHTDLYDFAANVEGAKEIFVVLKAAVTQKNPDLATSIETRFTELDAALNAYRHGDDYTLYTDLTPAQTKVLAQAVDALAEPLAQLGEILIGSPSHK